MNHFQFSRLDSKLCIILFNTITSRVITTYTDKCVLGTCAALLCRVSPHPIHAVTAYFIKEKHNYSLVESMLKRNESVEYICYLKLLSAGIYSCISCTLVVMKKITLLIYTVGIMFSRITNGIYQFTELARSLKSPFAARCTPSFTSVIFGLDASTPLLTCTWKRWQNVDQNNRGCFNP